MQDIEWRDRHIIRILVIALGPALPAYILFLMVKNYLEIQSNVKALIFGIAGLLFSVYYLTTHILPTATSISKSGIRVGNIIDDKYDYNIFSFKRESPFLKWSEIRNIKIVEKNVWHTVRTVPRSYLVVQTARGKTYETFLAQPKGFVTAMKKLNKSNILSSYETTRR